MGAVMRLGLVSAKQDTIGIILGLIVGRTVQMCHIQMVLTLTMLRVVSVG